MGWFPLGRKGLSDDELRDALFDAAAVGDAHRVEHLTAENRRRLSGLFESWKTLPPQLRSDPARTKWWAEGVIAVASAAAELGEESFMRQLQGTPENNIILAWQQSIMAAESEAEQGNFSSAIRRLEKMLESAAGLKGSAVEDLLPKTYGLLGTLYYRNGDIDRARGYTIRAKVYCEQIGDTEGVEVYRLNLATIDASR